MTLLLSGEFNLLVGNKFNTPGCYMMSGLVPSETLSSPIYIGSSVNLKNRIVNQHLKELDNNIHNNLILQNYYNKHGKENITVWLLENADINNYRDIENKYFNLYTPFVSERGGFNISEDPYSVTKGRKHSDQTKKKIGLKSVGRFKTKETREKLSMSLKGHPTSVETRKKISKGNAKMFRIKSPEGIIVEGFNLKEFCQQHDLSYRNIQNVLKGKVGSCKKWTHPDLKWEDIRPKKERCAPNVSQEERKRRSDFMIGNTFGKGISPSPETRKKSPMPIKERRENLYQKSIKEK